jgi:transposase-like protein
LGITSALRKGLASTNLIESLFSVVRAKIHRVKNWQAHRSQQILRRVASAIVEHRKKMRRVRGMGQAASLIAALRHHALEARAA